MQTSTTKTIKYYWEATKGLRWSMFTLTFFQALSVIFGFLIIPIFLRDFLDTITNFTGDNRADLWGDLWPILLKILGAEIIGFWVCARIFDFLLCDFESKVLRNLEKLCFKKIHNHSVNFFAGTFVGSIVNKIGRFVWALDHMIVKFEWSFLPNIIRFTFAIIVIAFFSPLISLILFVWGVFFFAITYYLIIKKLIPLELKEAASGSRLSGEFADSITNASAIKLFASLNTEDKRINKTIDSAFYARRQPWFFWAKTNIFQTVFFTTLNLTILFLMVRMWIAEEMTIGTILMIQLYLSSIFMNFWNLGNDIKDFYKELANANEMTEILELDPDIKDVKITQKCKIKKGEIEFKNVDFRYEEDSSVFKNFDLKIPAAQRVGIVGESGAGKTTLSKLILRFADIDDGEILIDGQNIAKIKQDDLRRNISFVPQEPVLFHRSLLENIGYGDPKASVEKIKEAAKFAHADEFILNTSDKYETKVGERGVKLSGGERQRIAIARAMLKNAPILFLDEATSSLDSKSEKFIQDALDNLMKDRTTIVIAHRLSTLKKMDRILVFDNGEVIEDGTHAELLEKKGKYAELWGHQVGGFIG